MEKIKVIISSVIPLDQTLSIKFRIETLEFENELLLPLESSHSDIIRGVETETIRMITESEMSGLQDKIRTIEISYP